MSCVIATQDHDAAHACACDWRATPFQQAAASLDFNNLANGDAVFNFEVATFSPLPYAFEIPFADSTGASSGIRATVDVTTVTVGAPNSLVVQANTTGGNFLRSQSPSSSLSITFNRTVAVQGADFFCVNPSSGFATPCTLTVSAAYFGFPGSTVGVWLRVCRRAGALCPCACVWVCVGVCGRERERECARLAITYFSVTN